MNQEVLVTYVTELLVVEGPPGDSVLAAGTLETLAISDTELLAVEVESAQVLQVEQVIECIESLAQGPPGPPGPSALTMSPQDIALYVAPAVIASLGGGTDLLSVYQLSA